MTGAPPPTSPSTRPAFHLRPGRGAADVPVCVDLYFASMEALLRQQGQPVGPRNPTALAKLFEHLLTTDPGGTWLAVSGATPGEGEPVAFAMSSRRGDRWFLGFLFVLEAWQGRGIGRALMEAALPADPADPAEHVRLRLGVCAEAIQPISTGLYASRGMLPRLPIYLLTGDLRPGALRRDPVRLDATPFSAYDPGPDAPGSGTGVGPRALARVSDVDRALLGFERPEDHRMWRGTGRLGLVLHRPGDPDGEALGYGYVQPSGRIGPVLVREPSLLEPALAELTSAVTPAGGWQAYVPGVAGGALLPLMAAGMRIDGGPAIFCATDDGPPFDRYLPMNSALI
ncbi:MAG: GNAT family N-acetyltransferase [Chloroflexota bacterium]